MSDIKGFWLNKNMNVESEWNGMAGSSEMITHPKAPDRSWPLQLHSSQEVKNDLTPNYK